MKKTLTLILLSTIMFFGTLTTVYAEDDYARITELDYKAVVVDEENSHGKVVITERLTFDIHAASSYNLFWELWRVLPEEYVDGVKVDYKVNYVKEIKADGTEVTYAESPQLYWFDSDYIDVDGGLGPEKWFHSPGPYDDYYYFESLLFYVDGLYRETVVFEIQYEMNNASLRYNDASELYLALFSGEDTQHLKSLKAQILIPSDKMPRSGNYDAYTYGTNAESFDFVESDSLNPGFHTFAFELDESKLQFKKYNQYIEFALISYGEDKHIFTENASINDYYHSDMLQSIQKAQSDFEKLPLQAQNKKRNILIFSIGSGLAVFALAIFIHQSMKKRNPLYKPSQDILYFRDIPSELDANFARRLVFSKSQKTDDTGDGYSAALLSLAYKDYLELERIRPEKNWSQKNTKIVIQSQTFENKKALTEIEQRYFQLILRHVKDNEISLDTFQDKVSNDYEYTESFLNSVKSSLNKYGVEHAYFQKANYKKPRNSLQGYALAFVIVGILVTILGNLSIYNTRVGWAYGGYFYLGGAFMIAALYLLVVSRKFILLTQFGEDEYAKWYGLYHFLDSETLMKERDVLDLVIWEQYLIYATAFGISDKVIKALKVRVPEEVLRNSTILYNPMFRSRAFYHTSSRSFHSATRTASFTSRSGGHGGFGGGGRGGGGGGGGH